MATKRYGPTLGAGVSITEEQADKTITQAPLGVVGYVGILQKGRVGELTRIGTTKQAREKIGSYIPESVLPDVIFDFYEHSVGRGEIYAIRVTDGSEKKSYLNLRNRSNPLRSQVVGIVADNGGRWAGKKQTIVGQYTLATNTTLETGKTVEVDEWKGGIVTFGELAGKSFQIEGNDATGVITLKPDATLLDQLTESGGGDLTYAINLTNDGKALSVLIKDGTDFPDTQWAIDIFEDGVLVKSYDNLSSDPSSARYFVPLINDDDSNYYIKVSDEFVGTITPDTRPANFAGISSSLTSLELVAKIAEIEISSVGNAKASFTEVLGSNVIKDKVTLTVTVVGTRPVGNLLLDTNPANDTTLTVDFSATEGVTGTKLITFKTSVVDATTQVLIGGTAAETRDNLLAFLQGMDYANGYFNYVAGAGDSIDVTALDANDIHNAGTEFSQSASHFTLTQLSGGVDEEWSYVSENQADLPVTTVVTGKAFAAPNSWLIGGVIHNTEFATSFALSDKIFINVDPFPVNSFVGGVLIPNKDERRVKYEIVSNTANSITVKSGSDMTTDATVGDGFIVQAAIELGGGYDGIANISDQDYIDAYSISDSPFKNLLRQNKGLVKLATPSVTATAVQKAGLAFASAYNYQYRVEVPSNITTDEGAEQYINETIGRNDFGVVNFPSFAYVSDPEKSGVLKLISITGQIHGREALIANNFGGYFKTAAGVDVTLPRIVKLPTGDRVLDEEFLNPQGINVIKKKDGVFIVWGGRTIGVDTAFKFKHQREYLSHVEHVLQENFDFIIFAINNPSNIGILKTTLNAYFLVDFNKGAFEGDTFKQAVLIKIDKENNTPLDGANGDLNAQIKLKIVNTIERLNISIGKAGIFESLA